MFLPEDSEDTPWAAKPVGSVHIDASAGTAEGRAIRVSSHYDRRSLRKKSEIPRSQRVRIPFDRQSPENRCLSQIESIPMTRPISVRCNSEFNVAPEHGVWHSGNPTANAESTAPSTLVRTSLSGESHGEALEYRIKCRPATGGNSLLIPGVLLLGLIAAINGASLAYSQSQTEINQMLRTYSDDIATEKSLVAQGLGSPGGAAISYSHRAKVYLFHSQKPEKAVADFSEAIRLLMSKKLDDTDRSTLAGAYVFRAQAHNQLKKRPLALADAAAAIKLFEDMVKSGAEHAEPTLVYALKMRVEALIGAEPTDQSSEEDLKQALAAVDQAIPLLEKWSKKGSDNEFFQSELTQLRETRIAVVKAIDKLTSTAK